MIGIHIIVRLRNYCVWF